MSDSRKIKKKIYILNEKKKLHTTEHFCTHTELSAEVALPVGRDAKRLKLKTRKKKRNVYGDVFLAAAVGAVVLFII